MESSRVAAPPRHIVLVGGMGSGKSTVARRVADRLNRPLTDSDDYLMSTTGRSGRQIAGHHGVSSLHQTESEHLLEALASPELSVVAAAASVVEGERCLDALSSADVVWLRTRPETAVARISDGSHRRRLGPDDITAITALTERRAPLYGKVAGLVIDTDDLDPEEVAEQVLAWLETRDGN